MSCAAGMVRVIRRGSRGFAMAMRPGYGLSLTRRAESDSARVQVSCGITLADRGLRRLLNNPPPQRGWSPVQGQK